MKTETIWGLTGIGVIVVLAVVMRWMSDVSESNERAQARAERAG